MFTRGDVPELGAPAAVGEPLRPEVVLDVIQTDVGLQLADLVLLPVEESQSIARMSARGALLWSPPGKSKNFRSLIFFLLRCLPLCLRPEKITENARAETDSIKKRVGNVSVTIETGCF